MNQNGYYHDVLSKFQLSNPFIGNYHQEYDINRNHEIDGEGYDDTEYQIDLLFSSLHRHGLLQIYPFTQQEASNIRSQYLKSKDFKAHFIE